MSIKLHSNHLKMLAVITMTIDHIGYLLLPQYPILRLIGRLSFPIFAYLIANGYAYTRNTTLYFMRVFGFAILTQVLFFIFEINIINVLFTYTLGILAIYGIEKKRLLLSGLCLVLALVFNPDYNFYGVALVMMFYFIKDIKKQALVMFTLTILLFIYFFNGRVDYLLIMILDIPNYFFDLSQFFAIFALFIVHLDSYKKITYVNKKIKSIVQYGFYLYYPVHFIILTLIGRG